MQKQTRYLTIPFVLCLLVSTHFVSRTLGQRAELNYDLSSSIKGLKDPDASIRRGAASKLRELGHDAAPAVPALRVSLKDSDSVVRMYSAMALAAIGREARAAVPELIEALKDNDLLVRRRASSALGSLGPEAQAAVPVLIDLLKDRATSMSSANALGDIGAGARDAIPALIDLLSDSDPEIRSSAAEALGGIGPEAKKAVPQLTELLKDQDPQVRNSAAFGLGFIGPTAVTAVPALIQALGDSDDGVRINAAQAIASIGPAATSAIPPLINLLKDQDAGSTASRALASLGPEAKAAIPALIEASKSEDKILSRSAAVALGQIANSLSAAKATDAIGLLKDAQASLLKSNDPEVRKEAETVKRNVSYLELLWWEQIKHWVRNHPYFTFAIVVWPALLLICLLLLWLHPIWLLEINETLSASLDVQLPPWLGGIKVPLRYFVLVGFFGYHPRVLDAWVVRHVAAARDQFSQKTTVEARKIHLPSPVELEKETLPELTPAHLRKAFASKLACLLICAEGGAGKTSLACLLGKWAMSADASQRLCSHLMLPVLIDQDLEVRSKGNEQPFFKMISDQLRGLIAEAEPTAAGLLYQLLKRRRVLVIVDSFSEMSEATRGDILAGATDIPVNSLIITSRKNESLNSLPRSTIKPLRIKGNRIASFLEVYLAHLGKRELFDDDEDFFDACRRLSSIVGERDITALLAKLYADQIVRTKERVSNEDLPENIPELMLCYLNDINRGASATEPDDATVHRVSEIIAWECLRGTLRPMAASLKDVLSALGGERKALPLTRYLEHKLKIIYVVGVGRDRIRFSLDPLCEYLAALHLVNEYGNNEDLWRNFLNLAKESITESGSVEFLLATRDCCLSGENERAPAFVVDELANLAGLDPAEVKKGLVKRKLKLIQQKLRIPDSEYRAAAVEELSNLLSEAKTVLPLLIKLLKDKDLLVREKVVDAIGNFGSQAKGAVPVLIELLNSQEVIICCRAAAALGHVGPQAAEAVPGLRALLNNQDEEICKFAAYGLGCIGPAARDAFADVAQLLRSRDEYVRGTAVVALTQIGAAKSDVNVLIDLLESDHKKIQIFSMDCLGRLGPEGEEAVPALIGLLNSHEHEIRGAAIGALMRIGPEAESGAAVPALVKLLKDPNPKVQRAAAFALARIGPKAEAAIGPLVQSLEYPSSDYVRMGASLALGNIGPAAKAAKPALTRLLSDPDETVCRMAADALKKIESDAG